MKTLLDTNIVIHRESSSTTINRDIGVLYKWLDNLHYTKCIHPLTIAEINKLKAADARLVLNIKLDSYNVLQAQSPLHPSVRQMSQAQDKSDNDRNDTLLLNELFLDRVDILITEDRKIRRKAEVLSLAGRVFTIEAFLEKVAAENPGLADYKVLAVRQELFGNVDVTDEFFDSFREDYQGFDKWFGKKSEEIAYVCRSGNKITAFLYLKVEDEKEPYHDITPPLTPKKRLKIGTLKVTLNGYKLGERFLKIVFDNALRHKVAEIYVTIFNKRIEQQRLIALFEEFGFTQHGAKHTQSGSELVYVRSMNRIAYLTNPKITYPFFSRRARAFIVPIYPEYHTNLLPDSILRTESPKDFVDNEPFRNAISKVYVCRSIFRDLHSGDVIVFYRTSGIFKSVISTIGIVENVITNLKDAADFVQQCRKRSVFTDAELMQQWNYSPRNRPFITNFLYAYSFPHRLNMKRLLDIGVIKDVTSAPRGFERIDPDKFDTILKETQTDESVIVD
jgi:hypothetical protein